MGAASLGRCKASVESSLLQVASRAERGELADEMQTDASALGPAAHGIAAIESLLEKQADLSTFGPWSWTGGPNGEGMLVQQIFFWLMIALFMVVLGTSVPYIALGHDCHCCADLMGKTIEAGIETFDESLLGVKVSIGRLSVNPMDGYVDVEKLIIHNPKGYTSKYLLSASKVLVDLDMFTLVRTCKKTIKVDRLLFQDITVNYEKKLRTSNVQEVLDHMGPPPKPLPDDTIIELHKVDVQDVGAEVRPSGAIGNWIHMQVAAGDVHYHDYIAQVGEKHLGPIVQTLLRSVLKTVLINVAGKSQVQSCM